MTVTFGKVVSVVFVVSVVTLLAVAAVYWIAKRVYERL